MTSNIILFGLCSLNLVYLLKDRENQALPPEPYLVFGKYIRKFCTSFWWESKFI
jgi:hypothetical protein